MIWTRTKRVANDFVDGWMAHDLMTLAAALAFYTALSLGPLLLILLAVVGLMGENAQGELLTQINRTIGHEAAAAVSVVVNNADQKPQLGTVAGWVGVITLLFSASGVFAQLQSSLNVIWRTSAEEVGGVGAWMKKRLLSMGMVLALGFLATVSLGLSAVLSFVFEGENTVWTLVNSVVTLGIFAFVFAMIFHYLPDRPLPFRKAFIGGMITSVLFSVGKGLIGLYLGRGAVGSAYGAAGSLLVLLVWVYYSSLIVFIGAELTRALVAFEEEKVAPSTAAVASTKEKSTSGPSREPILT